ncbi:MAG: amidohydrolase family protein, partial [Atopobiaceae bacterium]|nr:amidohydrolase family protein [Atopobiaceae bacterium]
GLMWTRASGSAYQQELDYLGAERMRYTYPGRSIIDQGGIVVNHSDYPVAQAVGVPIGVYMSVMRTIPTFPEDSRRDFEGEGMSRMDALRGMTTNVAYMWHAEDRMGSLSIGKLANMAVFDKDFLEDDIEDIAWARCLATIVDGEQVYEIGSDGPVGPTVEEMIAAEKE